MTTLPFISRAESQTPRYQKVMKVIFMFKGAGDISFSFSFFFSFCIVIIPLFAHIALCLTLVLHSAVLIIIGCPMQAKKTGYVLLTSFANLEKQKVVHQPSFSLRQFLFW